MSAAEKLKALVEGFYEDTAPSGHEAPVEIIRALPQIVAVVEAVEYATEDLNRFLPSNAAEQLQKRLLVALTALDRALA